jgi:hypothetical protein
MTGSELPPLEQLLSRKQTAKLLGVSEQILRSLGIHYLKLGRAVRYDPADIRKWIAENKINPDHVREGVSLAPLWKERKRRLKEQAQAERRAMTVRMMGEGYVRRKEERERLGLPLFGRLPKGALAEARRKAAEKEAKRGATRT